MVITYKAIKDAYLVLKSYAYQENLNLFLKHAVALFEQANFENSLSELEGVLGSNSSLTHPRFKEWLQEIEYKTIPKKILRSEDHNTNSQSGGVFISNVKDSNIYEVRSLNYFIDAPIELHIIEILWAMNVGVLLDDCLSNVCYGNRLSENIKKSFHEDIDLRNHELFKRYINQYNNWRDTAISIATDIAKAGENVAILSLDLQSYFYNIQPSFAQIANVILHSVKDEQKLNNLLELNSLLEEIVLAYHHRISSSLEFTHSASWEKVGLPIGFASSSIISNWYLDGVDAAVIFNARPVYYGRYVDDMMMVFKKPVIEAEDTVNRFIASYLNEILFQNTEDSYYINVDDNRLPLQKEKLILQFFDKKNSHAGLELFKQELDERSSAFKFLPTEHVTKGMNRFAYDILYEGSSSKFRSIVGLAENETELAKYLSTHIAAHRLCRLDKHELVLNELKLFFRGQNALRFSRLWEKVYQYALITKKYSFIYDFYEYINRELQKIAFTVTPNAGVYSITEKLIEDFQLYNELSLGISLGLLDIYNFWEGDFNDKNVNDLNRKFIVDKPKLEGLLAKYSNIHRSAISFRYANLIRHNLVAWPLSNYSDFNGDLTDELEFFKSQKDINTSKIELSPRFIHFDEWQLFHVPCTLAEQHLNLDHSFSEQLIQYKSDFDSQDLPVEVQISNESNNPHVAVCNYKIGDKQDKDTIRIGIANLVVNLKDIDFALRRDKEPNLSFSRQENLYQLLNAAIESNTEILVLPEVSIPVSWLPFMAAFSRRNQISLVFGLEHWVVNGNAFNLLIEIMPFKISEKYNSCVVIPRLKNHYAPHESELITAYRLTPGNQLLDGKFFYHKINWRGICFASYNCYELSDITHRTIFRSEIDLLIACVWNKDTKYYEHILESTVRDIHCYTVQSNTSQYGGSCILRPTKTESKVMLYVKGGENACLLTSELDIKALRNFQFKSKPAIGDFFKHLPPGYESDRVLDR